MKRFISVSNWSILVLIISSCSFSDGNITGYPIKPVAFNHVKIQGGFWTPRLETNRDVTVWYDFKKCEDTGRISNFAVAGGLEKGRFNRFNELLGNSYLLIVGLETIVPRAPGQVVGEGRVSRTPA